MAPKQWLRDGDQRSVQAIFKYANDPNDRNELYSLGFERVAYRLGVELGLPIPETHLQTFDGKRGAIQVLHPNAEWSCNWHRAERMAMWSMIVNRDVWPLAVAFDLWIANVDRHHRNMVFEPIPPDRKPMLAASCSTWFPDHGHGGLYPPAKFGATDVAQVTFDGQGRMAPRANDLLRSQMPPEYRQAFTSLVGRDARRVLDRIRRLPDSLLQAAVQEVPSSYWSARVGGRTVDLLKARRDSVDILVAETF